MHKLVVTLLLTTTAVFATTTFYYSRELQRERTQQAAQAQAQQAPVLAPWSIASATPDAKLPAPEVESARPLAHKFSAASAQVTAGGATFRPDPLGEARADAQFRDYNQDMLDRMSDPEKRAEMLAEFKVNVRSQNPRLAQAVGLSDAEADRLVELLALQQMEQQATGARCALDPQCSRGGTFVLNFDDNTTREINKLLGAERQRKMNEYRTSMPERSSVTQLRSRLNDADYLQEEQAEALIKVLADERERIMSSSRDGGLSGVGNGVGMVYYSASAKTPEARLASAEENTRRLTERAAEVLTPAQLQVFEQMQAEILVSSRPQLRSVQSFSADPGAAEAYSAVIINQSN